MKNKLKVLDIVAWWPNKQNPGLGSFIKDQVLSTSHQCEHQVLYLSFTKSDWNTLPRIEIISEMSQIGVHYIKVTSPLRKFGFHDFMVKSAYLKAFDYLEKEYNFVPDLAHVHVRSHFTKIAIDLLIKKEKSMVLSEHFSFYNRGIDLLNDETRLQEMKDIKRQFNAPTVRKIMPVSYDLKKSLKERFEVADKMEVVPNIANAVFFNSEDFNKSAAHFVCCANWDHPKDPMTMLKGLKMIEQDLPQNFHLDVIGDGPLLDPMKAFVKSNLSSLSIAFHGYQQKVFIAEKLQKAKGLLHPTTSENLPTIIIEGLICGTPVLSMNINGIPEMIDDSNGILAPIADPKAFSIGLSKMLTTSFNYARIANEARQKYSAEVIGAKIMGIYKNSLAQNKQQQTAS